MRVRDVAQRFTPDAAVLGTTNRVQQRRKCHWRKQQAVDCRTHTAVITASKAAEARNKWEASNKMGSVSRVRSGDNFLLGKATYLRYPVVQANDEIRKF